MRVLLVDSYDSYTYNLYQLLLDVVPDADVVIVRNDQFTESQLPDLVARFDFIVIGPGPGNPLNASDIGFLDALFAFEVPILGICLGFQILCMHYGGEIKRLKLAKHGQISALDTAADCALFEPRSADEPLFVTRYHSLSATTPSDSVLSEVAWADDIENGRVTMAVEHTSLPFAGVQYHPESICSHGGPALVRRFLKIVERWNVGRSIEPLGDLRSLSIVPRPLISSRRTPATSHVVLFETLKMALPAARIAELLGVANSERFVMLDSAAAPSRYSMLAALQESDASLTYTMGDESALFGNERIDLGQRTIWQVIANIMADIRCTQGPAGSPFWGGLSGYFSYEAGVATLDVHADKTATGAPDVNLIMVKRSIVVDYESGITYIQSIVSDGQSSDPWITSMRQLLQTAMQTPPVSPPAPTANGKISVTLPKKEQYIANILRAQELLAEGQSYELCLTGPTRIDCESKKDPWTLYRTLRCRNPSPFACFMRLPGVDLLSSSPERFLSWTRDGLCELRPIKGTIRKQPSSTLEDAKRALNNPKDYAENLMIVDLIRHDLHQVAKQVSVPSLMQVEEYETVYQLVSVIQGFVGPSVTSSNEDSFTGFDVLAHALPPGSMTGAPKKRSVELLQTLEGRNRGVYSGVCGYLSVCGAGDWSVIIRSAFRHTRQPAQAEDGQETWWIGAGGAITALSDPEAEWEEMLAKLQSTLPSFGDAIEIA